ncbi:MAG: ParB/RepB/Spo0J family partition protein [Litorimonas sp.]
MDRPIPYHAPVDEFVLLRGRVLAGQRLMDVQALQGSIARFGLLSPIVAVRRAGRLVVVDGRKRLAAIRRLAFEGRLPRSLVRIPYLLTTDQGRQGRLVPRLVANRSLFETVLARHERGESVPAIASALCVTRRCIRDVLSLGRLAPSVREAFFRGVIDFDQAQAFAALPDPDEQNRRFARLGPFASVRAILSDVQAQPVEALAA